MVHFYCTLLVFHLLLCLYFAYSCLITTQMALNSLSIQKSFFPLGWQRPHFQCKVNALCSLKKSCVLFLAFPPERLQPRGGTQNTERGQGGLSRCVAPGFCALEMSYSSK